MNALRTALAALLLAGCSSTATYQEVPAEGDGATASDSRSDAGASDAYVPTELSECTRLWNHYGNQPCIDLLGEPDTRFGWYECPLGKDYPAVCTGTDPVSVDSYTGFRVACCTDGIL